MTDHDTPTTPPETPSTAPDPTERPAADRPQPTQAESADTDQAESAETERAETEPVSAEAAGDESVDEPGNGSDATEDDAADQLASDVPGGDEEQLPLGQTSLPVGDEGVVDDETMRRALEAILMVTDEPLPVLTLARAVGRPTGDVAGALADLAAEYTEQGRGFDLREVGGGWRYYTRVEAAPYVERFVLDGQQARLTQAALETLAVVAYKQPVSRARVSAIRGVNVDGVMRTLVARGLVEEAGADTESQATLYRTTTYFLERMGMQSLDDLPELAPYLPEMDDVEEELAAQSLPPTPAENPQPGTPTPDEAPATASPDEPASADEPTSADESAADDLTPAEQADRTEPEANAQPTAGADSDAADAEGESGTPSTPDASSAGSATPYVHTDDAEADVHLPEDADTADDEPAGDVRAEDGPAEATAGSARAVGLEGEPGEDEPAEAPAGSAQAVDAGDLHAESGTSASNSSASDGALDGSSGETATSDEFAEDAGAEDERAEDERAEVTAGSVGDVGRGVVGEWDGREGGVRDGG